MLCRFAKSLKRKGQIKQKTSEERDQAGETTGHGATRKV
jgi:hypothetical protein